MQIIPTLKFNTTEIKHIFLSAAKMATRDESLTDIDIQTMSAIALGDGEWELSATYVTKHSGNVQQPSTEPANDAKN